MYPTTLHPSPVKDGRRVLGEKTANACLSSTHHRPDVSPSKRPLLEAPSPPKLLSSPLFAGQKRTIDQVNEDQANNDNVQAQHGESRAETQTVHDVHDEACTHSTAHKDDRPNQQQADAMEPDVAPSRESDKQQPQSPTHSTPLARSSSQESEASSTRTVPEDPETRKLFIQKKASLLRNRIQNAMRHVKNPQFDRRLSELEAHSRKFPRLSLPETLTPSHQKEVVTPRRQDEDIMPSSVTPRALQPAVEFKPRTEPSSIPLGLSSPPLSTENDSSQDPMKTPTQSHRRTDTAETLMQLSSPPATVSRTGRDRMIGEIDEQEDDIEGNQAEKQAVTPSQRGDAVDGLLKLMNTADKRETANTWTG
ncbi:hypothetical protein BDV38DRAFT_131946 [Aspergillus pseudotamarii]|uniref:Uncharacterized protein n=1 Tax=Aspergillus pseudotamarii TaxID=132259 RepID=A0A5N6SPV5_ASPPS|nr:uncharacterized protein BDV38DRAFT_131946 [Aspergillus pseudotamarii]KAE8135761.1 hypothetical protein BDV38DRAFT_131946 [Aspergillus pseudotamarii]